MNTRNAIAAMWLMNSIKPLLTAYQRLYEETLATQSTTILGDVTLINRATIISQLVEIQEALNILKAFIQKHQNEPMVLVTAITQHLKWSVGANPSLQELMNNFSESVMEKHDLMNKVRLIAAVTLKDCTSA